MRYSRILRGRGSASIWCVEMEWRRTDRHRWHKLGTILGALQNLTWPSLVLEAEEKVQGQGVHTKWWFLLIVR